MDDQTFKAVMDEISRFCGEECGSVTCCPEELCVLYRIERLIDGQQPTEMQ